MPRLLSLFDGTGAICKPFREAGWEIQSLDVDGRFGATLQEDILQWDYKKEAAPDVIVSGTPCEQYSTARTRGGPRNYALADALAAKQWEIIKYFLDKQPVLYFIENPAFSHLWKRPCAMEFKDPHVICDFCTYGSPYRKRTRWASNSSWTPRPLCIPQSCVSCSNGKSHDRTAQRGPCKGKDFAADRFTIDQLHAYPEPLCQEIFDHCQRMQWEVI